MINWKTFIKGLVLTGLGMAFHSAPAQADAPASATHRLNILIVYMDDLSRGDIKAYGCPDFMTPHIDSLAADGVKLTNAYAINTPCSPSRCGLMMGMYTQRFGKYGLSRGVPIPNDKPTLAETMRKAGYVTGFVGAEKWDIGSWNQGPLDRGFMEMAMQVPRVEGREGFGGGSSFICADGSYVTEVEGQYVLEFLERHAKQNKPFFLYYTPTAVHVPNTEVPVKYLKRLYPEQSDGKYSSRQYLGASLLAFDDQLGLILKKLRDLGIEKNTLVIFSSDNGGDRKADARIAPYRGYKHEIGEGNFRMPMILSLPGTLPAGKEYNGMASMVDFYPTATAVAGVETPKQCDGKNLLPLLLGEKKPDPNETLCWLTDGKHGGRAVRWKQWRLVQDKEKIWRLYDIENDPAETTDLAGKSPEIVREMDKQFQDWLKQMPQPRPKTAPPKELRPYTLNGQVARHPFGQGWMTVEKWNQIKDDPTQWGEKEARQKMLQPQNKKTNP